MAKTTLIYIYLQGKGTPGVCYYRRTEEGDETVLHTPTPLGHFINDFTKKVFIFLNIRPPPFLSFSVRPCTKD